MLYAGHLWDGMKITIGYHLWLSAAFIRINLKVVSEVYLLCFPSIPYSQILFLQGICKIFCSVTFDPKWQPALILGSITDCVLLEGLIIVFINPCLYLLCHHTEKDNGTKSQMVEATKDREHLGGVRVGLQRQAHVVLMVILRELIYKRLTQGQWAVLNRKAGGKIKKTQGIKIMQSVQASKVLFSKSGGDFIVGWFCLLVCFVLGFFSSFFIL